MFSEGTVHLQIYQKQTMHTVKFILVLLSNTQNTREDFALSISPFLVFDDNTRICNGI